MNSLFLQFLCKSNIIFEIIKSMFCLTSKGLLCSQQCPGKNAVILTKPGL